MLLLVAAKTLVLVPSPGVAGVFVNPVPISRALTVVMFDFESER